jgi:hypothetical protein
MFALGCGSVVVAACALRLGFCGFAFCGLLIPTQFTNLQ